MLIRLIPKNDVDAEIGALTVPWQSLKQNNPLIISEL